MRYQGLLAIDHAVNNSVRMNRGSMESSSETTLLSQEPRPQAVKQDDDSDIEDDMKRLNDQVNELTDANAQLEGERDIACAEKVRVYTCRAFSLEALIIINLLIINSLIKLFIQSHITVCFLMM